MPTLSISLLGALLLDRLLGEPRRYHPLVMFGNAAAALERAVGLPPRDSGLPAEENPRRTRLVLSGALACLLLVCLPVVILLGVLAWLPGLLSALLAVVVLYVCIGGRSLAEHADAIARPLQAGDLAGGQAALAAIVSRDTQVLDASGVACATVESVLENGNDAVFASLFWFALAGPAGALAHRLINTLDAMWGYRTARYRDFGWAAARIDDVLAWLPARVCALSYALVAGRFSVLSLGFRQAADWDSPNAGPVMAVGAASLGVTVGRPALYDGTEKSRPLLGQGEPAGVDDIARAVQLVTRATLLFVAAVALGEWLI